MSQPPMQHIIQHLFNSASLTDVPREQLEELVEQYPSFGVARYLLSRKLKAEQAAQFTEETLRTNLYFNNPYWLQYLLQTEDHAPLATALVAAPSVEPLVEISPLETAEAAEPIEADRVEPPIEAAQVEAPIEAAQVEAPIEAAQAEATPVEAPIEAFQAEPPIEAFPVEVPSIESSVETTAEAAPIDDADPSVSSPDEEAEPEPEIVAAAYNNIQTEHSQAEGPSAADQLLESIAALRLTHQQMDQQEEELPAESPASLAIEAEEKDETAPSFPETVREQDEFIPYVTPEEEPAEQPASPESEPTATLLQSATAGSDYAATQPPPTAEPATTTAEPATTTTQPPAVPAGFTIQPAANHPLIPIEPYHTIDYFASQGIKLTLDDNPTDKLGKQLKSFTDWLKVMRKLPQKDKQAVPDIAAEHQVRASAAHSIEGKEIVTETMAEVLVKQGMREKAIDVYMKLSLLDPQKSAYFASKIEQLKID